MSLEVILIELAFIKSALCETKLPVPMLLSFQELPLVNIAIRVAEGPFSVELIIQKFSLIGGARLLCLPSECVFSFSIFLVICPFSFVDCPIFVVVAAIAMFGIALELSFIFLSRFPCKRALPITLVIQPESFVY